MDLSIHRVDAEPVPPSRRVKKRGGTGDEREFELPAEGAEGERPPQREPETEPERRPTDETPVGERDDDEAGGRLDVTA